MVVIGRDAEKGRRCYKYPKKVECEASTVQTRRVLRTRGKQTRWVCPITGFTVHAGYAVYGNEETDSHRTNLRG